MSNKNNNKEFEKDESTIEPLELEEVSLIFKNFSGRATEFNAEGNRVFSVLIEEVPLAQDLMNEGWNVRELEQDEGHIVYHLSVKVNYDSPYPPRIFIVQGDARLPLTEHSIAMLDYSRVISADVRINPYHWRVGGKSGISAYLSVMYVHIEGSRFDEKYGGLAIRS
jgi:hypothetical protein